MTGGGRAERRWHAAAPRGARSQGPAAPRAAGRHAQLELGELMGFGPDEIMSQWDRHAGQCIKAHARVLQPANWLGITHHWMWVP